MTKRQSKHASPSTGSATVRPVSTRASRGARPVPSHVAASTASAGKRHGSGRGFAPIALLVALLVAALAGGALWMSGILAPHESTPEDVQRNAEADLDYGLPTAADLAGATAESLTALAEASDATTFDNTDDEERAGGGVDLIRLPDGVSLATAGAWYLQGVDNLSASDAVKLLNGSWRVTLAAGDAYDCRLRYAVFDSKTQQEAVTEARTALGLDSAPTTDQGTDSYGNTYVEGTYEQGGTTYAWRIAACPLGDVYSNEGLPADASYVVASMTS